MLALRTIVHPTDFSDASGDAFAHALRIALSAKCGLTILHIAAAREADDWMSFPHVRETLARWGLMSADEPAGAVGAKLGVKIAKVALEPQSTIGGILDYLDRHAAFGGEND
jgi:nucleotide-binding universal stress UspA family protein